MNEPSDQSVAEQNRENEEKIYDRIMSEYGYGSEIWKKIVAGFCMLMMTGFFTINFSGVAICYKKIWNLEDSQVELLGFCFFISKAIGNFSCGWVTHYFNRVSVTILFVWLGFFLNGVHAIWENYSFFLFVRIATGLLSGVVEVIAGNILCEFVPIRNRCFTITSIWSGYNFSQLLFNIIMLFTAPHMEPEGMKNTQVIFIAVFFVMVLLISMFLNDSPIDLILQEREEEAFEILYKFKSQEYFTPEIREKLKKEIKEGENKMQFSHACSEAFGSNYLALTLSVGFLLTATNIINDGLTFILNSAMATVNKDNSENATDHILTTNILINALNIIGNPTFGILAEIKILGRKRTIFISLIAMIIVIIPGIFLINQIAIFYAILQFLLSNNNLITTYGEEVFPTKIRDLVMGWLISCSFAGSSLAQPLFSRMIKSSIESPFYVSLALCVASAFVIWFCPVETYGRPLDNPIYPITKTNEDENLKLL